MPALRPALFALLLALPPAFGGATRPAPEMGPRQARPAASVEDGAQGRVIVQYRSESALMQAPLAGARGRPQHAAALGQRLGLPLRDGRVLGTRMQALHGEGLSSTALAARLRAQADVEWAVVDERRTISAAPNDPYYGPNQASITPVVGQWYLRAPDATAPSAINAAGAWDLTPGSAAVTVAVLDTGVRFDHPDLSTKLYPGYDFVTNTTSGGDGGGRDADASDPGDWTTVNECSSGSAASTSSWHGTQTAGLVGAATDNSIGMASVGRHVMVLPVRVLGKCGGSDSDIIAAMYWAAGISPDSSLPANPHPAQVLSMSFGKSGACPASYAAVFTALANAGVTVVVAAGNEEGLAVSAPANCSGAIAVAGVRHVGTKVGFSSIGPEVAIAAPAGNCINSSGACLYPILTTINLGRTTPSTNGYSDSFNYSVGTSFSTPIVAGTVALMLAADATLKPAAILAALRQSARPFPTSGALTANAPTCRAPTTTAQDECYCTTSTCGAGLLDAAAAVAVVVGVAMAPPTAAIAASSSTPTAGQTITLSAAGSSANGGRSISGWQWQITSGGTLAAFSGATNASTATLATSGAGTVTVSLVVTDSGGATGGASSTIRVAAAPITPTSGGSSSGGGAMSAPWLGLLSLAVLALRRARRSLRQG